MTCCIAAVGQTEKRIVAVTDLKLSVDWMSYDTQILKLRPISRSGRWIMMFAGDPSEYIEIASAVFAATEEHGDDTIALVMRLCEEAYRAHLAKKIEVGVLGPYGITMPWFLRKGLRQFGEDEFARLNRRIEDVKVGADLMVMGFDVGGRPYIFTLDHPGLGHHESLRFHAIGTGHILAFGWMAMTYDITLSPEDLAYRMCEAKFASEGAMGVGEKTYVLAMSPDGTQHALKPENVAPLRDRWRDIGGPPPVPEDARELIADCWMNFTWNFRPRGKGL